MTIGSNIYIIYIRKTVITNYQLTYKQLLTLFFFNHDFVLGSNRTIWAK